MCQDDQPSQEPLLFPLMRTKWHLEVLAIHRVMFVKIFFTVQTYHASATDKKGGAATRTVSLGSSFISHSSFSKEFVLLYC